MRKVLYGTISYVPIRYVITSVGDVVVSRS